jgi:hypothetical protein
VSTNGVDREGGVMATPTLTRTAARSGTGSSRLVAPAAATYVFAWIAGLTLGTSSLGADATDAAVRAHYVTEATVVALQATLVHLVAGSALAVLTLGVAPLLSGPRARSATLVAGLLAGVLSMAQALVAYAAAAGAADRPAAWSRSMLDTITTLDTVKLLLLAAFVGLVSATLHSVRLPRSGRVVGIVTSVLLVLGAASFVVSSGGLQAALALSLVLLLAWVATLGVVVRRARRTGCAA